MTRTCGDCTLCCFTLGVAELKKPTLQWCQHCNIGVGCTIYSDRPKSCCDFSCLWLSHPETPDEMKPRKTGVVVWVTESKHVIALTRRHDPTAWRNPAVLTTLRKLAKAHTVVAFSGARAWLVGPNTDEELPSGSIKIDGFGLCELTLSLKTKLRVGARMT